MKFLNCLVVTAALCVAVTTAEARDGFTSTPMLTTSEEQELNRLLDKMHGPWPNGVERRQYFNANRRLPVPPGCFEKSEVKTRNRVYVRVICPKG